MQNRLQKENAGWHLSSEHVIWLAIVDKVEVRRVLMPLNTRNNLWDFFRKKKKRKRINAHQFQQNGIESASKYVHVLGHIH